MKRKAQKRAPEPSELHAAQTEINQLRVELASKNRTITDTRRELARAHAEIAQLLAKLSAINVLATPPPRALIPGLTLLSGQPIMETP